MGNVKRFTAPRGSSANWKNEPHTPSTSKQNGEMQEEDKKFKFSPSVLTNTKKNLNF